MKETGWQSFLILNIVFQQYNLYTEISFIII